MAVSKTSDHIQIKIKMPNPSQEPPVSSKAPNEDLKDMDILCTFKIKIESQNLDHGCFKNQWPHPNQDEDAKPQSGASSVLQSPKSGLKGHECSLHFQNQYRESKLRTAVTQRQVTMKGFKAFLSKTNLSQTKILYLSGSELILARLTLFLFQIYQSYFLLIAPAKLFLHI